MADEQVQKLLQGALKAAREGNTDQARKAFLYVLKMQPTNEVAWMGLATVAQDQREQVIALQKAVEINPQNARAQAALDRILKASGPAAPPPLATPSSPNPSPLSAPVIPPAAPERSTSRTVTPPPPPAYEEDEEDIYEDEDMSFEDAIASDDDVTYDEEMSVDETYEDSEADDIAEPSEAVPPTMPTSPVSAPAPTSPVLPETPLFSLLTLTPTGEEGVPVPKRRVLETATQKGDALINAFLRQEMEDRLIEWSHKPRGRKDENQLRNLRASVGAGIFFVVLLIGGPLAYVYMTSPEYQKLVFAPTHTITPTLTSTPTNTPGATLTSSPTPLESSTPTPTLDLSVTPGRPEVVYRPEPTEIYFPPGIQRSREIEAADALINEGKIDQAVAKLQTEQNANALTGDFMPAYYLARIQMAQGDYEAAQKTVTEGRVLWVEKNDNDTAYDPMIMVSEGRLQYNSFKQQIANGTDIDNLKKPIDEQIAVIKEAANQGGSYDEPYLLLADLYALTGDYGTALQDLTTAQTGIYRGALFANTRLRLKKAELYRDLGNLDQALFELDDLLRLNPFEEPALSLRMDIAMQKNNPGLVVIYAEAYQYYYPENIKGYRLMGDAFVLENKIGLAMVQYTRALQGDPNDPSYGDALASRAAVYSSQGRDDLALTDLFQAVEIQPQNMDFRWQRYQLAYRKKDYALAAEDLTVLQTAGTITQAQFTILNTRLQIDQAALDTNGQQQALTALRRLRPADVPADLQPTVNELIARLNFALGNENDALNALDSSLEVEDTASRRVLRGQILQAQADATARDEPKLALYLAAQREYDFVLSWSVIYRYDFADDLQARYDTVTGEVERLRAAIAADNA